MPANDETPAGPWIYSQGIVADHARVHMEVQMRHFLERSLTDGMPDTYSFQAV